MAKKSYQATLGRGVRIDTAKLIAGRMLITANSGGGKSWTVRKLCEETFDAAQQIILDWDGEYHTLRENYDYLLFGKDGDYPATIQNAAMLAKKLLELGTSAIIDLYELGQQRQMFVQRFLDALVNAPRELWHPVIVVVDEAHKLAPEGAKSISANAVIDLATLGRKRGFACVLATQRLAKLDKDAAAECNNVMIGRIGLDVDAKRAADSLGFASREDRLSLRELGEGEFYGYGPAFNFNGVHKFKVGDVATTHLRAGEARAKRPPPPSSEIKSKLAELKDLPRQAEAEAKTISELQDQVKSLKCELATASKAQPKEPPAPKIGKADLKRIDKLGAKLIDRLDELREMDKSIAKLSTDVIAQLVETVKAHSATVADADKLLSLISATTKGSNAVSTDVQALVRVADRRTHDRGHGGRVDQPHGNGVSKAASNGVRATVLRGVQSTDQFTTGDTLPRGEQAILTALIQFPEGCKAQKLTALTGYTQTSRDAYITRLAGKGLVMRDRPGHAVAIQPQASQTLPNVPPLPTGDALRAKWESELPRGEAAVFKVVCEAYPETIHVSAITDATGYTQTSRDAYITRMASKEIIKRVSPGVVQASADLFE